MGRRYDAPGAAEPEPEPSERSNLDLWKAMDEGRDPTERPTPIHSARTARRTSEESRMSHHGNTPAAWTAVVVALLGFVVGGVGLMLDPIEMAIFWVGVAIVVGRGSCCSR